MAFATARPPSATVGALPSMLTQRGGLPACVGIGGVSGFFLRDWARDCVPAGYRSGWRPGIPSFEGYGAPVRTGDCVPRGSPVGVASPVWIGALIRGGGPVL